MEISRRITMNSDPSLIGTVQDVYGATITVSLNEETITGLSFVEGECYRIGQVGSFVRIPLGFVDLYGIVSQVGAGAAPVKDDEKNQYGNRWLQVQLVGEGRRGGQFQRGVSQHPTIDDKVHIVTEKDLYSIYGPGDPTDFVEIGHLASAESIPAYIDINKLITRHSAVVGTTGCGKSTTVAGLLSSLSDVERYPSARIVVLDIHGEYAKALSDRSTVFRISANLEKGEKELCIPFWALNFDELVSFAFGAIDLQKSAIISDWVIKLKRESLERQTLKGVSSESITVDSPVPFCLHKLWFELYKEDYMTIIPKPGDSSGETEPAFAKDAEGNIIQPGDAMKVIPPLYRTVKQTGPANERVQWGKPIGIRQQLAGLASKLRDPRFSFICNPGDWLPDIEGTTKKDLDELLQDWIGRQNPITILDLSGIPSGILNEIIGAVLRILYDAVFWARNLPEGGRERPLLLVLEEAHAYLRRDKTGTAADAVRRIAKEGRKYGVGLMVISQRPSEIDSTILSQCGTIFAMRLSNETDRGHVAGAASDNLKGLFETLPVLRTGEAIVVGEAVSLPVRTLIEPPSLNRRPDSTDPRVVTRGSLTSGFESPGGWNQIREKENYAAMVYQWRIQSAKYDHQVFNKNNETKEEN